MASLPPPGPPGSNVYVGSSVENAFHEANRRWHSQRDSDPNRLSTHEIVEQAFEAHGLRIVPDAPFGDADLDTWLRYYRQLRDDGHLTEYGRGALEALEKWIPHLAPTSVGSTHD